MRLNSEVCVKGFFWICFESQAISLILLIFLIIIFVYVFGLFGSSNTGGLKIDVGLECYREEMMLKKTMRRHLKDLGHVVVVILVYCANALVK
ncbi:hypothetical protein MKW92_039865 [Papaver armeniacum]|nr:hypothetical protein MKW92_039865 [Papaver armeniacum]